MRFSFALLPRLSLTLLLAIALLSGCSVNQVTGKRQMSMSFDEQVKMGNSQYGPAQQQQGGRYVVDPDLNVYVNEVGQSVAKFSPVKLPYEFVVLNNDVPNAWALPGGKIAINRGLLVLLDDEAQLASVLGHEVIHAAAEHSAKQMRNSQILGIGVAAAAVAAGMTDNENAALIGLGAALGAKVYQAHYGRSQELEADFYGIDYMVAAGYDPQAAVELQMKFVELSKGQKSNGLGKLFASHPPSEERVKKNQQKANKLPKGKRNQAAYQQAIAQIIKDQPAYAKHNEALLAANNKQLDSALSLSNQAIKMQPNEAMFYVTKGKILSSQNKEKEARNAFAIATKKNPDYYMGQLALGVTEAQLGNKQQAKSALQKSYLLLPTSLAAYNLGQLEEQQGNTQNAVKYYKAAASENSNIGKAAQQKLRNMNAG
ncbi:Putative Zn-dependent protease, contains TPR repeats [Alteromonadaceae bacterium Bs31]|nr:Putative Zn-dependent protease, contains TPR repeats [Alteromonadaceae bacterium Bs31]